MLQDRFSQLRQTRHPAALRYAAVVVTGHEVQAALHHAALYNQGFTPREHYKAVRSSLCTIAARFSKRHVVLPFSSRLSVVTSTNAEESTYYIGLKNDEDPFHLHATRAASLDCLQELTGYDGFDRDFVPGIPFAQPPSELYRLNSGVEEGLRQGIQDSLDKSAVEVEGSPQLLPFWLERIKLVET